MGSEEGSKAPVRLETDPAADETSKLQIEQEAPKTPTKTVDDFLQLGWYNFHAVCSAEFIVFNMLCNMVYMVYGGFQPIVKSCGDFHANTTGGDICAQYDLWRPQNECVPQLEYQFKSVNVEVSAQCYTLIRPHSPALVRKSLMMVFVFRFKFILLKMISEWEFQFDYLCSEGKAVKTSISIQMLGILFGT
ncbi:unnamed protein product, partial [Anisakis simplex]|uniref:Innexin n=1 Tax=Anisakis simplex TaxID=6269 RepID=A0A0M3JB92_ANISI